MSLQICGLNVSSSQKELQPHGTIDFPCAAYESAHSGNASDIIPWHWHEELEIVYIKEGTLKLQIPAKDYVLNAGDLVILNANLLHSAIGAPYGELCSLVFSPFLLTGNSSSAFYVKYIFQNLFTLPCRPSQHTLQVSSCPPSSAHASSHRLHMHSFRCCYAMHTRHSHIG